jgi:hypothetical protein
MSDIQAAITRFYARWHALERQHPADAASVLDFDMAPRHAAAPPFPDRLEALRSLMALQERVALEQAELKAGAYLAAKLEGSEAFLRAWMGERLAFAPYLQKTLGIAPERMSGDERASEADALARALGPRQVTWDELGRTTFRTRFGYGDRTGFGDKLRSSAAAWVVRIATALGLPPAPVYRIEEASEDAYWSAWIDGSIEDGVRLRVNRHPRIELLLHSDLRLAVHEIAGHALHLQGLLQSVDQARLDEASLNLTVHACESFQMEGIAQTALHAFALADELPEELLLLERYALYRGRVVNDAQHDVEDGMKVEEAHARAMKACPLLSPLGLQSELRDRGRSPLHRCYSHVYAPSRRLFLRSLALPEPRRRTFWRTVYTGLYTPAQLDALLTRLAGPETP